MVHFLMAASCISTLSPLTLCALSSLLLAVSLAKWPSLTCSFTPQMVYADERLANATRVYLLPRLVGDDSVRLPGQ